MSTFIAAYKGYITDVPELWFKRFRDNKLFHYDQLTAASFAPQVNFSEVNAGWSLYPVAYLPGQSNMEMQCTSGQFTGDMFAMANDQDFIDDAGYSLPYTNNYVPTNGVVTIETKASIKNTLVMPEGLTLAESKEAVAAGTYFIEESAKEDGTGYTTTITFGDKTINMIEITHYETMDAKLIKVDNQKTAVGELIARWPVYGTGDEASAKASSGVKGYVIMKVHKCRVTTTPGFDTSYKSVATNSVTFSALSSGLPDGSVYELAYVEVA